MKITIQTAQGPRTVPDWAKCHCVTRHTPNYIHPYPFALPSGDELWLCPNTYHQAITLLKVYKVNDGPPSGMEHVQFNYFVRALMKMYWQQIMEQRQDAQAFQAWVESQRSDDDYDVFEEVKKVLL